MIFPMLRVRVMGPRDRLTDVLAVLQDVGLLHLAPAPESRPLQLSQLTSRQQRRRRQLLRLIEDAGVVLDQAPETQASPSAGGPVSLPGAARLAHGTRRSLGRLDAKAASLEEEQALLQRYQGFFGAFESLLRARALEPGFSAFHVVLRADQAANLPAIRQALAQLLGEACETLTRELPGGETALLLLVPASRAAAVEQLLAQTRVQEVPVPSGYGPTLMEAIPRMRARAQAVPEEVEAVRRQRADLLHSVAPELARARVVARDLVAQLDVLPLTAVTAHGFVLDGWLPAGTEPRLTRALERAFGATVVVEIIDREHWHEEDAPVVLRNPRLFRPFELLTGMLPLPRYGTIDPTP